MNLAILFWFYKEPEICKDRLELIKRFNPEVAIYGLYGGPVDEAKKYSGFLQEYLDDFYITSFVDKESSWLWINGDIMILDWYESRGKNLVWDSIMIVQWDMLIYDSIVRQFKDMTKDQIFLSGYRTLDKGIEGKWNWTRPDGKERENFLRFMNYVDKEYNYRKKLKCCLFILEIFPRSFFEQWSKVKDKEVGMLEYRIPTFAEIFHTPVFQKDVGVWWFNKKAYEGKTPMNARALEIEKKYIEKQLRKNDGYRIFHPYFSKSTDICESLGREK